VAVVARLTEAALRPRVRLEGPGKIMPPGSSGYALRLDAQQKSPPMFFT
jgi:hypothetical protein